MNRQTASPIRLVSPWKKYQVFSVSILFTCVDNYLKTEYMGEIAVGALNGTPGGRNELRPYAMCLLSNLISPINFSMFV